MQSTLSALLVVGAIGWIALTAAPSADDRLWAGDEQQRLVEIQDNQPGDNERDNEGVAGDDDGNGGDSAGGNDQEPPQPQSQPGIRRPLQPGDPSPDVLELATLTAATGGFDWLAARQQPNGSWKTSVGYKLDDSYLVTNRNAEHPGVTALAGLAMMAAGNRPGTPPEGQTAGPYDAHVQRALDCICDCVTDGQEGLMGYVVANGTRMYSHCIATWFLAEVYLASGDRFSPADRRELRASLNLATYMLVSVQNRDGGWGYHAYNNESDLTIVSLAVLALRVAADAGIRVPTGTLDRARSYVLQSRQSYGVRNYDPDDKQPYLRQPTRGYRDGTFLYQSDRNDGSRVSWALTGAAVTALQLLGIGPEFTDSEGSKQYLHKSIWYLRTYLPFSIEGLRHRRPIPFGYFYGQLFAGLASYGYGQAHPEVWDDWWLDVRLKLLLMQHRDEREGVEWYHWSDAISGEYATAMACLILSLGNERLAVMRSLERNQREGDRSDDPD